MFQGPFLRPTDVADLWRARFGEPPPIMTDSETMLRVLESTPPAAKPKSRRDGLGTEDPEG